MKKFSWLMILGLLAGACNQEEVLLVETSDEFETMGIAFKGKNPWGNARVVKSICGEDKTVTLWAGQHIPVGEVSVYNDAEDLHITLSIEGDYTADWFIRKSHLFVGLAGSTGDIKNPAPGKFPYSHEEPSNNVLGIQEYTYSIPLNSFEDWTPGAEFDIALHAEVVRVTNVVYDNGVPVSATVAQNEGAWGEGRRFTIKGSWAMNFQYTIQDCLSLCDRSWMRISEGSGNGNTNSDFNDDPEPVFEFDINVANNRVGRAQFQRTLTRVGGVVTGAYITVRFSITDGIGEISFEEFSTYFSPSPGSPEAAQFEANRRFDQDGGEIILTGSGIPTGNSASYYVGLYAKVSGPCKE
jgi:hypothetical protein